MNYFDVNKLKEELNTFDKLLEKMAFTPTSAPPPPMTQMPPQGGQPPMDPAMAQGAPPMPPQEGQPPMDPAAMQGGQPPMDPAMAQGGQPPMDPAAMQGGAPAPGGMDPQFEGALAELAQGTQKLGEEVGAQRDQIDQLTQRLLQMEQQMSQLQDGLKQPAPADAAPEEQPIPGNQI